MSKYSEAVGVWNHKIDKIEHKIVPVMEDNERLANIIGAYQKDKDFAKMIKTMRDFYVGLVERSDVTLTDTDKADLRTWASLNQKTIFTDVMIAFKWMKADDLKKAEMMQEDELKKSLLEAK